MLPAGRGGRVTVVGGPERGAARPRAIHDQGLARLRAGACENNRLEGGAFGDSRTLRRRAQETGGVHPTAPMSFIRFVHRRGNSEGSDIPRYRRLSNTMSPRGTDETGGVRKTSAEWAPPTATLDVARRTGGTSHQCPIAPFTESNW